MFVALSLRSHKPRETSLVLSMNVITKLNNKAGEFQGWIQQILLELIYCYAKIHELQPVCHPQS